MSAEKVPAPPDPDPIPAVSSPTGEAAAGVARQKRKANSQNFGRTSSLLTVNSPQDNAAKKSILGG